MISVNGKKHKPWARIRSLGVSGRRRWSARWCTRAGSSRVKWSLLWSAHVDSEIRYLPPTTATPEYCNSLNSRFIRCDTYPGLVWLRWWQVPRWSEEGSFRIIKLKLWRLQWRNVWRKIEMRWEDSSTVTACQIWKQPTLRRSHLVAEGHVRVEERSDCSNVLPVVSEDICLTTTESNGLSVCVIKW